MLVQCSSSLTRRLALGAAGGLLALLGGCVVAPIDPYDVGAPVVYPGAVYGTPYYGSPYYGGPYYGYPAYARPYPYYWGPSLSLGAYGGWGSGHRQWHGPRGGQPWRGRPEFRGGREGGVRRP